MSPPILSLVAVFLAVGIGGGLVGARQIGAASRAQARLVDAREHVDALQRMQLDEETGLRGFLATGLRSFLQARGGDDESFATRADELHAQLQAAGLPLAVAAGETLRTLHVRWQREVEAPLLDDPQNANRLPKQRLGKELTDRMSDASRVIRSELTRAYADVGDELTLRINAVVGVSVGTIASAAIAALVLGLSRASAMAALAREQSLVAALQQTLRVDGVQLPRTAVGFAYTSATREALVGGDLIDSWRVDDRRGWFLIADASGKGIEAARHSAFVQYAIRTLTAECDDPAAVLTRFNRLFLETFDDPGIFVVLLLGAFDAASGEMRYASAGHSMAYIKRPGRIDQLAPTGSIIGLDTAQVYTTDTVLLATGDTVVLATDGLTESRDAEGELLGDEGVIALLRDNGGGPQAICDRLVAEVARRSRGLVNDDLAILVLRILDPRDNGATAKAVPFSTMTS